LCGATGAVLVLVCWCSSLSCCSCALCRCEEGVKRSGINRQDRQDRGVGGGVHVGGSEEAEQKRTAGSGSFAGRAGARGEREYGRGKC